MVVAATVAIDSSVDLTDLENDATYDVLTFNPWITDSTTFIESVHFFHISGWNWLKSMLNARNVQGK